MPCSWEGDLHRVCGIFTSGLLEDELLPMSRRSIAQFTVITIQVCIY